MGATFVVNMGWAAILCTLFISLYGFRTIPPVGSASMEYYDDSEAANGGRTTPTVPSKSAGATKPIISMFSATVVNSKSSRPTPDTDVPQPLEPSSKRGTSSEDDDAYELPGK